MKIVRTVKIGRHPNCDYQLNASSDKTSRNHATLYIYKDGTMELEDTSTNGTFVNGTKVVGRRVWVKRDDLIKFADQDRLDWSRINVASKPNVPMIAGVSLLGILFAFLMFTKGPDIWELIRGKKECNVSCIREKYDKSVGLLFHAYYLKVDVGNSKYFIGYNKSLYERTQELDYALTDSPDKLLPFFLTGTAFLVKNNNPVDNGNLITNRHVADPAWGINNKEFNSFFEESFINDLKTDADDYERILKYPSNPNRKFETHGSILKFIPSGSILDLNKNMTYFELINKIGTSNSQVLRWSKDENVDIAVLVTEKNPGHKYIDVTKDIDDNLQKIEVGSSIVVMGYSGGISSGYNSQKSDLTYQTSKGSISKNVSNFEIAYDIRTEGGSSGAPVINEFGKVIGINFARNELNGLGIPIKHLKEVLNYQNVVNNNVANKGNYGQ
jgi:hypothetical protein